MSLILHQLMSGGEASPRGIMQVAGICCWRHNIAKVSHSMPLRMQDHILQTLQFVHKAIELIEHRLSKLLMNCFTGYTDCLMACADSQCCDLELLMLCGMASDQNMVSHSNAVTCLPTIAT